MLSNKVSVNIAAYLSGFIAGLMQTSTRKFDLAYFIENTSHGVADIIASETFLTSKRSENLSGEIYAGQIAQIEYMCNIIEANGFWWMQNFLEIAQSLTLYKTGGLLKRSIALDLVVQKTDNHIWFFEIKTPKPNKDIAVKTTRRLLTVWAINQTSYPEREIKTYYAMPYNPYGTRSAYNHSFAKNYLDMQNQVLLQEEFWDMLGGSGTYREILQIYEEVGNPKGKSVIEQVALGF